MPDEDVSVPAGPKSNKRTTILVIGGLMLAEGAMIFGAMKFFGADPAPASAETVSAESDGADSDQGSPGEIAEVVIAELDAYNNLSGRLYIYHLQVSAQVNPEQKEKIEALVLERAGTISDRINTVIRGIDPKHLNEPRLETVRRQIKFELDKVFGDDSLILELLIPKLLQSRANL